MNTLLILFVAITAVAIVLQLLVLVAIYFAVRKASEESARMARGVEQDVLPFFVDAHRLLAESAPKVCQSLDDISATATMIREKTAAVGATADDAVDRARLQLLRADHLATQSLDGIEATMNEIHSLLATPKRHLSALLTGLAAGIGQYIMSRRG